MDVNLTISLMRGQMGVVIEKAVSAAVETVLGEMIRVMSLKFEQLRREMSLKEKENQDIRKMLETSRCQMKILRQKYISAVSSKDDRTAFIQQHRHTMAQFSVPTSTNLQQGAAEPTRDLLPNVRRSSNSTTTTSPTDFHLPVPITAPVPKPRTSEPAKPQTVIHQDLSPTETYPNNDHHNQEVPGPGAQLGLKVEMVNVTVPECQDPLWAQTSRTSAEVEHLDLADLNLLLPVAQTSEVLNPATADTTPPLKVKQEEAEVKIIQVKQEQFEPSTSEAPVIELQQDVGGAGLPVDLPVSKQCIQIPSSSVTEHSVFMGVNPSTCFNMSSEFEEFGIRKKDYKRINMEKTRRYRERINADPVKRAAVLAERRRRYREKKDGGRILSAKLLSSEKRIKLQQKTKQLQRIRAHF